MTYRSFSLMSAYSNHLPSDRFMQIDNLFGLLTNENSVADMTVYNLLQKDKTHYEMTISVPGYTQDELDISIFDNILTISGKPKIERTESSEEKYSIKWLHRGIKKKRMLLQLWPSKSDNHPAGEFE